MKVYNLRCNDDHRFEGWFSSEEDFIAQSGQRQISCPLCGNCDIAKLPSAPRLNLSGAQAPIEVRVAGRQEQWLNFARELIANSEDVGTQFAEEARRMHYHEIDQRNIRGLTTADERNALGEEGIEVLPFVMPSVLKHTLQ